MLCMGILTGSEGRTEVGMFFNCCNRAMGRVKRHLPSNQPWMVDGARGFRQAILQWATSSSQISDRIAMPDDMGREVEIGMCWYHVMHTVHLHKNLLPNSTHSGQLEYEVRLLADTPPDKFDRAWQCLKKLWAARKWHAFLEYFEALWIKDLNGWHAGYLGVGCPRTNCGLEGSWPDSNSRFPSNRVGPIRLSEIILKTIIPYYVKNPWGAVSKPTLDLSQRQFATKLAVAPSTRLLHIDGYYYCRKRTNGVRPALTKEDVQLYANIDAHLSDNTVDDDDTILTARIFSSTVKYGNFLLVSVPALTTSSTANVTIYVLFKLSWGLLNQQQMSKSRKRTILISSDLAVIGPSINVREISTVVCATSSAVTRGISPAT